MSFLTAADVTDLTAVNLQGFATKQTVFPDEATEVVFSRWSDAQQDWTSIAPQQVIIDYADRQERTITNDAGQSVTIDGWLTGFAPMDVERGDLFALGTTGDEERAEIVLVRPARLGTQRAAFRLRLGEA